jgi:soluble lytic murein transglycosylase-like protein
VWATLETEGAHLDRLQSRVRRATGLSGESEPQFPDRLAGRLWSLGLAESAVRWNPGGMPGADAAATLWTAQTFVRLGAPWRAIGAADLSWRRAAPELPMRAYPRQLREAFFPLPDADAVHSASAAHRVPWELVAAVAREESRFDPTTLSQVGARGLMQLMPATAAGVAARLGMDPPEAEALFDPQLSLDLGAAELSRLLRVFAGRKAPAVAAYNAGEAQARLWLEQCGPLCDDELYVLNITFRATRHYTAQVVAGATIYRELYGSEARDGDTGEDSGSRQGDAGT